MALHANPKPVDPYNPTGEHHDRLRHPSPYLPIRIPVFTPVVFLNDLVIRAISIIGLFGGPPAQGDPVTASRTRRPRALSESVESVEEGEGVPLPPQTSPTVGVSSGPRVVSTRVRVSRGGATSRKID